MICVCKMCNSGKCVVCKHLNGVHGENGCLYQQCLCGSKTEDGSLTSKEEVQSDGERI